MEEELLDIPSYLRQLGYANFPAVVELGRRAITINPDHIQRNPPWNRWRGIFEYLSCIEFARESLHALPTGRALGSVNIVPARYHSASLIFFARATLDNIAVWIADIFNLQTKGSDCGFHKGKFRAELGQLDSELANVIEEHQEFLAELENYRQEWIHRLSGGAEVFSDKSPMDSDAKIEIAVPINPRIDHESSSYLKMVNKCRQKNSGRRLYPITEFADRMANGTRDFLLDVLERILAIKH
jgi:hypothetical protein